MTVPDHHHPANLRRTSRLLMALAVISGGSAAGSLTFAGVAIGHPLLVPAALLGAIWVTARRLGGELHGEHHGERHGERTTTERLRSAVLLAVVTVLAAALIIWTGGGAPISLLLALIGPVAFAACLSTRAVITP
jgi:hypothetical protein